MIFFYFRRGVAQLVAHTAGGREVAGSSPVSPTINKYLKYCYYSFPRKIRLACILLSEVIMVTETFNIHKSDFPSTFAFEYSVNNYENINYKLYRHERRRLQLELLKFQEWCIKEKRSVAIALEGRDAAGKGSTAAYLTQYLNPRYSKIISLGVPTKSQMRSWLRIHQSMMPDLGQTVIFDRSWYSRAMIQPVMGYCSMNQYKYFLKNVNDWEYEQIESGTDIIKIYLSVSQVSQNLRLQNRQNSPLKYWKYSQNDRTAIEKWHLYTYFKERMFSVTSTDYAPWYLVKSDHKLYAQLCVMNLILSKFDYDDKNQLNLGEIISSEDAIKRIYLDGVLFDNLTLEQLEVLERFKIHAD